MPRTDLLWFQRPKIIIRLSVLIGIVLFLGAAGLWWQKVYLSPYQVFWDSIANNLASPSVIRHTTQANETSSLNQYSLVQLGQRPNVHAVTKILQRQGSDANLVVTENVATATTDYVRYVTILTTQKNAAGQTIDFKPVINTWAKGDIAISDPSSTLNQELFGIVPLANVSAEQRAVILDHMRSNKVYKADYQSFKKDNWQGRTVRVYEVKVNTRAYIAMLQELSKFTGLPAAQNFNAADYATQADIGLEFVIDPLSHQLVQVRYPAVGRIDAFGSFGMSQKLALPTATISLNELQNRLQSLQ